MFILKFTILLIILLFIPTILGELICYKTSSDKMLPFYIRYILGFFFILSLFWLLCIPMTFGKLPFTTLVITYSICLTILSGIAIIICHKNWHLQILLRFWKTLNLNGFEVVYLIVFLLLLVIQLYFVAFYEVTIWSYDDYEYVVRSLDTINSNHMFLTDVVTGEDMAFSYKRILNSWEIYVAYLAKVSGFHVTTIAHSIFPTILLLIAYLVYSFIATQLFCKRENQLIFLCILSILLMFGLYSPYSLTFRLLITLWQGKAVLSAIIVPFLITFLPKVYMEKWNLRTASYLLLISISACSLTMMGSGMCIIIYSTIWLIHAVYNHNLCGIQYCLCGCCIPVTQLLFYLAMR